MKQWCSIWSKKYSRFYCATWTYLHTFSWSWIYTWICLGLSVGYVHVDILPSNLLWTQGFWSQRQTTKFAIALAQHRTQYLPEVTKISYCIATRLENFYTNREDESGSGGWAYLCTKLYASAHCLKLSWPSMISALKHLSTSIENTLSQDDTKYGRLSHSRSKITCEDSPPVV